jgi:hypothetical protein
LVVVWEILGVTVMGNHETVKTAGGGWFDGCSDIGKHRPALLRFNGVEDNLCLSFGCLLGVGILVACVRGEEVRVASIAEFLGGFLAVVEGGVGMFYL